MCTRLKGLLQAENEQKTCRMSFRLLTAIISFDFSSQTGPGTNFARAGRTPLHLLCTSTSDTTRLQIPFYILPPPPPSYFLVKNPMLTDKSPLYKHTFWNLR